MSKNKFSIHDLSVDQISNFSRLLALAFIIVLGVIISDSFLSLENISNILTNASVLIIIGVGQTIAIVTNGPDLSSGSILTICAVLVAILMKSFGIPFPIAILAGLSLGALIGVINGVMISKVGIPSFVSTYGLMWAVFGFAYVLLHGYVLYDFNSSFRFIGNGSLFGFIPMPIVVMVLVVGLGIFVMNKTTYGRRFYAVGTNNVCAKMSGINVDRTVILAFVSSGFLSALAGIVLIARINAVQSDIGSNYLLQVLATVYMGGASTEGGEGTIQGTIIGALIITIVYNCMNLLAVPSEWREAVIGLLIILTVLTDSFAKKKAEKTII